MPVVATQVGVELEEVVDTGLKDLMENRVTWGH
jgi:hypothetical protein